MSQREFKESSRSLADKIEPYKDNSLSTTKFPDSESPVLSDKLKGSTHLLNLHDELENSDSFAPTSVATDRNKQAILMDLPAPTIRKHKINLDFSESSYDRADSASSSSTSGDSSFMAEWFFRVEESRKSTPLPNECESSSDTASTSEVHHQVVPELPDTRLEVSDSCSLDLRSTCGRSLLNESDSDESGLTDRFSWLRTPEGLERILEYRFIIERLRRKGYLLPFEIILLAFTLASCYMGAYNWFTCPADVYIPRYVFFNGAIASIAVCVEIMYSLRKLFIRRPPTSLISLCSFVFGWVVIVLTFIEMMHFYTMSYSFQRNEENYCSELFYWFVYYKNIVFGVLTSLAVFIHITTFQLFDILDDYGRLYL